ncbi:hypothetical protein [Novosphingobium sp. ERN07]|uniref:hypothetical protein n=1 Tax=Novosphingobium sp. ERN07 TaxID=2726187 RepID=UPI00197F10D4|nr:hypothetical protein [Novosphingobium sp. ERN07]
MLRHAFRFATLLPCTLALSAPALAQTAVSQEKVTAGDVVTKPLSDLNIKKDEVPEILVTAREKPYDLTGLKRCPAIAAAVANLDAVLGDDIDVASDDGNATIDMGNLAKSVVGSLIPFGGVIREISGANAQQRKWQEAIYAGSVRRAYLKGVGQQRGCAYPARAATAKDAAAIHAARDAAKEKEKDDKNKGDSKSAKAKSGKNQPVSYVSKPVVQRAQ